MLQEGTKAISPEQKPLVYDRMVVKAGTRLLTGGTGHLDLERMATLVGQLARLHQKGVQVLLVSSGAVAAGRHVLGTRKDHKGTAFRQVLAAVGQSRLVQAYEQLFAWHGITVAQALLTRKDLTDRLGYLNIRNTLLALLDLGVITIINENDVVAVEELEGEVFGDNDNLSAMVANLVDADLLVMLGEVEGLYTADPRLDPNARLIERVEKIDAPIEALAGGSLDSQARGGMATKIEAARLATASGVATVIASGHQSDVLIRLAFGEGLGTFFPPTASKMESRKRWMLSGLSTRGELVVDAGAVQALRNSHRSLLPAGVKEVKGSFNRGDIIAITDSQGAQLACGIANYSSQDIVTIKGHRSERIQELLGYHYGDEVVHRNNMVVL